MQKEKKKKEETKKQITLINYYSSLNDSEIGKWAVTLRNDIPKLIKSNPNDTNSLLKEIDDFAQLRIKAKKITSQDTADLKELILGQREKLNKKTDKDIQRERDRNSSITSSDMRNKSIESEEISTESSHVGHQSTYVGLVENSLKRKLEDENNDDIHAKKKNRVEKPVDGMNIDSESWNNNVNFSIFEKPENQKVNHMEVDEIIIGKSNSNLQLVPKTNITQPFVESIDSLENQIPPVVNGPKRTIPNGYNWKSIIYQGVPIFFKPNPKKNAKCKQLFWISFTFGGDHEWLRLHNYEGGKHHGYQYSNFDMNNFFRKEIDTEKNLWYT